MLDESSNINILLAKVQLAQSCCWSVKRTMDEAKCGILCKELGKKEGRKIKDEMRDSKEDQRL